METWTRTIVVTGGEGFVGSHLVRKLADQPEVRVISLDNRSSGWHPERLEQPNVVYIEGHTQSIEPLLESYRPDLVFHLGEYARVGQSRKEPGKVWSSNLAGTSVVFEYCRRREIPLVYAASSTRLTDEGKKLTPYTWSKAANVELLRQYPQWKLEGGRLRFAIAYLFNVYGPGEIADGSGATVIALFIRRHRENLPPEVKLPGTQKRNFTHVADATQGLYLIGLRMLEDPAHDLHEYQLGNPRKYEIREVAAMFPGPAPIYHPEAAGDRSDSSVDTSTTADLGWVPTRNLEDYIREEVAKIREERLPT